AMKRIGEHKGTEWNGTSNDQTEWEGNMRVEGGKEQAVVFIFFKHGRRSSHALQVPVYRTHRMGRKWSYTRESKIGYRREPIWDRQTRVEVCAASDALTLHS